MPYVCQVRQGLTLSFVTTVSNVLMFFLAASASDYGLFLSDEDPRKGIWLESGRTLDYYMLRNGVNICLSPNTLKDPAPEHKNSEGE